MVVYESDASDDELLASNASGKDLLAKSFTYTSKILSIANFFAKEAPWGIGAGILGLGGDALSSSGMGEIKDNLIALNAEVAELNKKADAISQDLKYLVNHIKDTEMRNKVSAFGKEADRLSWTVNKINSQENNAIANLMEVTDTASNEYHTYVNQINNTVAYSAGGGDTFAKDTLAFGKSILGDNVMESDSTLDVYVNLYNSRYNWSSQTIPAKSRFLAYTTSLYLKAYMISMCYMQSNNTDHRYDYAIEQMRGQFQKFIKKCEAYDTSMKLPDGKDINLIDGKTYAYDCFVVFDPKVFFKQCEERVRYSSGVSMFHPDLYESMMYQNLCMYIFLYDQRFISPPPIETLDSMKSRLSASGKNSLLDELESVGFSVPGNYLYTGKLSYNRNQIKQYNFFGYFVFKGDFIYHADLYNLKTGNMENNISLLKADIDTKNINDWRSKSIQTMFNNKIIVMLQ